jgi:hypothetical protein
MGRRRGTRVAGCSPCDRGQDCRGPGFGVAARGEIKSNEGQNRFLRREREMEDTDTIVSTFEGPDGELYVSLDDMLVLLKRRARSWLPDDPSLLARFDHIVEETHAIVKEQHEHKRKEADRQ